jgi:vacuolar iron transporter family protein
MPIVNRERHRTGRIGWLRAAVLDANDGILSTSSLVLGVAASHATHSNILVAEVAVWWPELCQWRLAVRVCPLTS